MNWKAFFANLAIAAIGGAGAVATTTPAGAPPDWKMVAAGAGVSAIANVVGLLQKQPHKDGQ